MYHPRQQRPQPFLNAPRPPASQQLNNQQSMDFQFPYPNQRPGEIGSVLGMQGRMDQRQGPGSGISLQRDFGSIPMPLPADNQSGLQQGVNWSSYQPPAKLFASHPSADHQGTHLQNQKFQPGAPNWKPPVHDLPLPRTQLSHTPGGGGESKTLYTPESAGSILAGFGLSNEDLEVLSHYPDDQLTPDTLPFILRNIQINKSGMQKQMASTSSTFSRNIDDEAGPSLRSSEVPSILTVTQTAGKIIDYGHASQQKYGSDTRKTFTREQLSNESTTRMYSATSSAAIPKIGKYKTPVLEHIDLSQKEEDYRRTGREKHRDTDYRRMTRDKRRSYSPPGREFVPSPKSLHGNKDYRYLESKLRSDGSSKRPRSTSSESRPHDSSNNFPTPTMISDFDAAPPKVYPHTCSLCNTNCDQEKDWLEHINTVDHTVACRVLRRKYPDWKPALSSRHRNYRNQASSDPKDDSPFDSISQSQSRSPSPRSNVGGTSRPRRRSFSPRRLPERSHRPDQHRFHSPAYSRGRYLPFRGRQRDNPLRSRTSSENISRSGVKRPRHGSFGTSRSPSSAAEHSSKHEPSAHSTKTVKGAPKPWAKTTKSVKPPPAKKKVVAAASEDSLVAGCLVYVTGIPKDATEEEVTDMVGSFGKINNVVLMPCSEEESEKGQTASVCMMRALDALAFVSAPNLCIREQKITASVAKQEPKADQLPNTGSKPDANPDKKAVVSSSAGGDANQVTSDQNCKVLITGLPESGWSETDIIQLVQPFGNSFDIILSTNARKALVSLADLDVAQEMVKVHSFKSAMVNNTEVKLSLLKQNVGLSTPVALYNLFMGSVDPLENVAPILWNRLLVIKNVPDTLSGSSEVVKLVQRFGKVKRNLVLNTSNMVICEMLTAVRALAVHKRFQKFPCVIQNSPLIFSRKPDPRPNTHNKVIAAYCDSSEVKPASDDSQAAAEAPKEDDASEISAAPAENSCDEKSVETSAEDESVEQTESNDDKTGELGASEPSAVLDTEPHSDAPTEPSNVLAAESETTEVSTEVENMEETSVSGEVTSEETGPPQLRTITQAMVDTLLEGCRATRTTKQQPSQEPAAPLDEEPKKTQLQPKPKEKAAIKKKVLSKGATEKKEVVQKQEVESKQEVERKEREKEERERKEREKEEREKVAAEIQEERAERAKRVRERREEERERREEERRERDRREEERRERDRRGGGRRERERRDWRRGSSERQSRSRSDRYRQSSRRDERSSVETRNRTEEEEEEDFPFNMSDFVTVDEVGDVAELPSFVSPTVPEETSQDQSVSPKPAQQDVPEDKPVESTVTQELSNEKILESEPASVPTAEGPDSRPEQDLRNTEPSLPASQDLCVPSEASGSDTNPEKDSTSNTEPLLTSAQASAADSSSDGLAPSVVTTKSEDEKESGPVSHDVVQSKKEASDSQDQDVHAEENQKATDKTGTVEKTEKSVNKDQLLPPYDPQTAFGLEYLVPKTGFFCKACSRFFCGGKVAEIGHCKSLKHYENLKKLLQKAEPASEQTPTA